MCGGLRLLLSDRRLGTALFSLLSFIAHQPPGVMATASSLWQRLSGFSRKPEVYVAMLPALAWLRT